MSLAQQTRILEAVTSGACDEAVRPMTRFSYKMWRIGSVTNMVIELDDKSPLEAIALVASHKDQFCVVETDNQTGKRVQIFYQVTKGQWEGRTNPDNGNKIYPLRAAEIVRMPIDDVSPKEPWAWSSGCDVVGHDHNLIDVKGARA